MTFAVIGGIALVVVLIVGAWLLRTPRQEPGVAKFRRHIDALSPESRREVMDRVQRRREIDESDDQ